MVSSSSSPPHSPEMNARRPRRRNRTASTVTPLRSSARIAKQKADETLPSDGTFDMSHISEELSASTDTMLTTDSWAGPRVASASTSAMATTGITRTGNRRSFYKPAGAGSDVDYTDPEDTDMERSRIWDEVPRVLPIDNPKSIDEYGFSFDKMGYPIKEKWFVDTPTVDTRDHFGESLEKWMETHLQSIGLTKVWIKTPFDPRSDKNLFGNFFGSPDFEQKKKVVVLVPGSGPNGCGIWSRRVLVEEGLKNGSMTEYVKEALHLGWGVVVTNPNKTSVYAAGKKNSITAAEHLSNVLETFLFHSFVEEIVFVGHRDGCLLISKILKKNRGYSVLGKVKDVCFIDDTLHPVEFEKHAPTITTFSARPFSIVERNVHFESEDVLMWPSRSVFSVFHILTGGSLDMAQSLVNAAGPPKDEKDDEVLFGDPCASWI